MNEVSVKAVAATGQLGTGFKTESLEAASKDADFIACDAGSTDPGPHYLGSGQPQSSNAAVLRDLSRILKCAVEFNIPALIGSAGTSGGIPHVDVAESILRASAKEQDLHFSMARIDTELAPSVVADAYKRGELRPLENAPPLTEELIRSMTRIVAMAGPEPFESALTKGAQVILSGRSSDTSMYVAIPHMRGIPLGVAYHAGKTLECGAAAARTRSYPDSMAAILDMNGFTIEPPNPDFGCSPQSVAAHTLYENGDPNFLVEPCGTLDTSKSIYTAVTDRAVRVTNSKFIPAEQYTVRLEAASLRGYRTVVIAGIRDPLVLMQLDDFIDSATHLIKKKVLDSLGMAELDYKIRWIVYGQNGTMGILEPTPALDGHEVGVVIDVLAPTQKQASAIAAIAFHTALHHPIKQYTGLISSLAFPFSPPALDAGPVYEFSINHVWALDDPMKMCKIQYSEI
jgi:hypothetical protein